MQEKERRLTNIRAFASHSYAKVPCESNEEDLDLPPTKKKTEVSA